MKSCAPFLLVAAVLLLAQAQVGVAAQQSQVAVYVVGEVRNSGNAAAFSVEAIGTFYDARGVVVQV
jgi:hypothetical protein